MPRPKPVTAEQFYSTLARNEKIVEEGDGQVEGELRSREYEKDGVTHRVFECRVESILKLDRAARQDACSIRIALARSNEKADSGDDLDS